MEEWRDVKGYKGLYQVSNLGRVKSLPRIVRRRNNRELPIKEKIIIPFPNGRGYLIHTLTDKDRIRTNHTVHHLVWDAFGDEERDGHNKQIDHIDNNPYNNCISNLRLVTASQNSVKRSLNRPKKSRYPNVSPSNDGTWEAGIMRSRKRYRMWGFKTEVQAYLYVQKLLLSLGESVEKY